MCAVVSPPQAPPGGFLRLAFFFADCDIVEGTGQGSPSMAPGLACLGLGVTGRGGAQR